MGTGERTECGMGMYQMRNSECGMYQMRNGECGMRNFRVSVTRQATVHGDSAFRTPHTALKRCRIAHFHVRDLVLPLKILTITPRGHISPSSCSVALATCRAAPTR